MALRYAALGLHVLQVHVTKNGDCTCPSSSGTRTDGGPCSSPGKHPVHEAWQKLASTDADLIRTWFSAGSSNLGILCGRSNIVTIDIDPRNGGQETFADLECELGALPVTVTAHTGGAGEHRLFVRPQGDLVGKLGNGVDLLRDGRQFLVEPSIHPSGGRYLWARGLAPGEIAIAELPLAWVQRATRKPSVVPAPQHWSSSDEITLKRARSYLEHMDASVSGQNGHGSLWAATCRLMHGFGLDDVTVRYLIADAFNPRCQPPWSERDIDHKIQQARQGAEIDRWRVEDHGRGQNGNGHKLSDREPPREVIHLAEDYSDSEAVEYKAIADREEAPAAPTPVRIPWRRAPEMVGEILDHAQDPWVQLSLGGEEVVRVRAGGIAVVMGPSGSGKSSLVSNFLVEHARHVGPAIALSIELPADEMAGRIVGMQCDASWEDALRGAVRREFMVDALNLPRLYIIERQDATLAVLERCIDAAAKEYPGEQILVAIDYTQLVESKEREVRMQVADALKRIDRLSRDKRVVTIAVSQMSRAAAKSARDGEKIGADSADGGAESAAIERFATLTLSIGAASEERGDGSRAVELSLGKGRMSGGDKVYPAIYWGRSGRWRLDGVPQNASAVRDDRDADRAAKAQQALSYALLGAAAKSSEPMTREDLAESVPGRATYKRSAIACLIAQGDLVEVQQHAARSRHWKVWTPDRAAAGNAKLVRDMENEDD